MLVERKRRERRRDDVAFFLIERRDRGSVWKYGSVLLAVAMLGFAVSLYLH